MLMSAGEISSAKHSRYVMMALYPNSGIILNKQFKSLSFCGCCKQVDTDLQHEVLLPARLVPPDCDSRALDILYLQGHVGIKLVWKCREKKESAY